MLHLCITGKHPLTIVIISSQQILKSKFIDSFNSFIQFREYIKNIFIISNIIRKHRIRQPKEIIE